MLTRLGRTAGWKWNLMLLLSLTVVAYAGAILVTRAFPSELAPSLRVHEFAISLHIVGAGLALALGPFQFLPQMRGRHPSAHRWMGRLYLLGVLAGGASGLYLAPFSYGGPITHIGFGALGVLWLATGLLAFQAIRARRIEAHRHWVTLSFALTFAGVALRLWLPGMLAAGVPFDTAYRVVAWLCWIPNLAVATVILRTARPHRVAPGRKLTAPGT
jgi:hypothetical protein